MATIENVADMLFSGLTSLAMGSYARTPPQAERTQSHRPQRGELLAEPALNVAGSISFRFHVVCVSYNTHTLQGFSSRTVSLSPHTKRQATSTQRQQKNWGWASLSDDSLFPSKSRPCLVVCDILSEVMPGGNRTLEEKRA